MSINRTRSSAETDALQAMPRHAAETTKRESLKRDMIQCFISASNHPDDDSAETGNIGARVASCRVAAGLLQSLVIGHCRTGLQTAKKLHGHGETRQEETVTRSNAVTMQ
jgi:hypothetical protein